MNLDLLINKMQVKYYSNLMKDTSKSNPKYNYFLTKFNELNKMDLTETEKKLSKNSPQEFKNSAHEFKNSPQKSKNIFEEEEKNESSESKEVVYSDDYLYKRSWTKLSNVHKIIKLKEFIGKLLIDDKDEKDLLKKEIINLVNSKKLTKKDKVKYDSIKGRVIAIPNLTYKNGKYVLKL